MRGNSPLRFSNSSGSAAPTKSGNARRLGSGQSDRLGSDETLSRRPRQFGRGAGIVFGGNFVESAEMPWSVPSDQWAGGNSRDRPARTDGIRHPASPRYASAAPNIVRSLHAIPDPRHRPHRPLPAVRGSRAADQSPANRRCEHSGAHAGDPAVMASGIAGAHRERSRGWADISHGAGQSLVGRQGQWAGPSRRQ